MFDQFPALQEAHNIIRASRSAAYFARADRTSAAVLQPLHVSNAIELLIGTNVSALDTLFEEARDVYHRICLTTEIQILTHPGPAECFVPARLTLEEAVKTQVAFLTTQALRQLRHTTWANTWLKAWQASLLEHNTQQLAHCTATLSSDYRPPVTNDFEQASARYLDQYGETGALTVAILGAFPFAAQADEELLDEILNTLQHLTPLLRMAQDTHIDMTERLNLSIFAIASTHALTINEAWSLIQAGAFPDLQERLVHVYQDRLDQTRRALLALRVHPPIEVFCQTCLRVASQIAESPKPS